MPSTQSISLITSWSEVRQQLAPHWDEILERSAYPSVFQTWDYIDAWMGQAGVAFTPQVIVVEENGEPIVIAPMTLGPMMVMGKPLLRQLTFLGCGGFGLSEYLDFLIPEGREQELLPAIFAELKGATGGQWDVINFPLMRAEAASTSWLREHLTAHMGVRLEPEDRCDSPYLPLPASWDDFMGSRSPSFRKAFKRKWNKLHREHEVKLLEVGVDCSVEDGIEHIVHLHNQRWGEESQAFSDAQFAALHRELAPRLHDAQRLCVILLEIDGEIAAGRYDFIYRGVLWNYQSGWLPKYQKLSPGVVMLGHSLQWAMRHGLKEYDFLIGESAYKASWSSAKRQLASLQAFHPQSLRAKAFQVVRAMKRMARRG